MSVLEQLKGKLIVSCQALPHEPLHSSFIMGRMAKAALEGGASGIRAQSKEDILEIKRVVDLPVIGIVKRNYPDSPIYITPTKKEIDELLETKCEIIALDATDRPRPNGETLKEILDYIHENGVIAMADCSCYEDCMAAEAMGFDCVGTTLFGYTGGVSLPGPDFETIKRLVADLHVPLVAEGKINTPQDLKDVYACGAYTAVVGSAITRPQLITKEFTKVLEK